MENLDKRLTEVEYILKKLDKEHINKIPKEIWDYIKENTDESYIFNYDSSKNLVEQNLSINTISILTYINIKYLLNEDQKKEMIELLRIDESVAENEKAKLYNSSNLFKKKEIKQTEEISLIEVKKEKWYERVFSFFKNIFNR